MKIGLNSINIQARPKSLLGLVMIVLLGLILLVLMLTVLLPITLILGIYLWWKTRNIRKQMREQAPFGTIIEGEIITREENQESLLQKRD